MSTPTPLHLPTHLPYPIKITSLAVRPDTTVERGTRLLTYSFNHVSKEDGREVRFGTWDSPIEGTVHSWLFKLGDTISARRSADSPAITVTEPCKHEVQLHGLCCLCGKDMTNYDYTGFSDASRASIQMTHTSNGPTVSYDEAQRMERETAQHLHTVRKLSLIVDLDQTIVHATVDPTVGEWIAEGEAWEARRAKREAEGLPPDNDDDEVNPNWEALKDVKKFRLGPEALGQLYWGRMGLRQKPKKQSVEVEGCMYYIKPRPGYKEFLEAMAVKYEMHVYTMGTRAYAEEVCAAIDPDSKIFGGRVLSRDESGSLTQKSLQRLFPSDQSMVVIIDDRADVWEWSPNLVKVIPFDFYVGIGDINSAFLPKLQPLAPDISSPEATKTPSKAPAPPPPPPVTAASSEDRTLELVSDSSPPSPEEEEMEEMRKSEILARNAAGLDAQVEARPLAKMAEELREKEEEEEKAHLHEQEEGASQKEDSASSSGENGKVGEAGANETNGKPEQGQANGTTTPRSTTPKLEKHVRKALLKNDDVELYRVQKVLEEVHRNYYNAFDKKPPDEKSMRRKQSRAHHLLDYDVRKIIPAIRKHTLDGTHLLFSSVIPLDTRPESTEIWRTAEAFGAKCYTELSSRITHVVAAKRGTVKVDAARRQGGIHIVWLSWFTDSIALWAHQDESAYLIDPEPIPTPAVAAAGANLDEPHQISSDPEPDADDWDNDNDNDNESRASGSASASGSRTGKEGGEGERSLVLDEVDWDEINDEVDAAMNESDDEDGDARSTRSARSGVRSGNVSEEEGWTDESNSLVSSSEGSPRKRKRLRSITPADAVNGADPDSLLLRSPLAKRKKVAAERAGTSKLKEAVSADDLVQPTIPPSVPVPLSVSPSAEKDLAATPVQEEEEDDDEEAMDEAEDDENENENDGDDDDDSDDDDDDEEGDDDFLARELGEDWG